MAFIKGTSGADNLVGVAGDDYILGLGGNDVLDGGLDADRLYGGDGDDTLYDFVDGGAGDLLAGGLGNDIFITYDANADRIEGGFGLDWYLVGGSTATVVDLLNQGANAGIAAGDRLFSIERFKGGGGNDRFLGGNRSEDFWDSEGDDFYNGRGGTDIFRAANPMAPATSITFELAYGARAAELAALKGLSLSSAQSGLAVFAIWNDGNANAIVDSGELTYQMDELLGVEHYVSPGMGAVMAGSSGSEIFYCQNVPGSVNGGAGHDYVAFDGPGFAGAMKIDLAAGSASDGARSATLTAVEGAIGSSTGDDIFGNHQINTLLGSGGDDALDGRGGNDRLDGGAGIDLLVGGIGDDILTGGTLGDLIDGGDGIDTGCWAGSTGSVVIRIGLSATGSGEGDGDMLVSIENAIGSAFGDNIFGDAGANRIEGLDGSDNLYGGGGDDTIHGDRDPESPLPSGATGFDPTATVGDSPEPATGMPYPDSNQLFGQGGNDTLIGGAESDYLYGGAGNDRLNGGGGDNNNLVGGTGNDIYFVRRDDDRIYEQEGEGTDRVVSGGDFYIYNDLWIEFLILAGTRELQAWGSNRGDDITGNGAANLIEGNGGNDVLRGGGGDDELAGGRGRDSLTGGAGADWFRFDSGIDGVVNVDTIEDFVAADDTIILDRRIFEGLASDGRLAPAAFRLGTAAGDVNDRIIYDQATGRIFYDADGNGVNAAPTLFARVDAGTVLTAADFVAISNPDIYA